MAPVPGRYKFPHLGDKRGDLGPKDGNKQMGRIVKNMGKYVTWYLRALSIPT